MVGLILAFLTWFLVIQCFWLSGSVLGGLFITLSILSSAAKIRSEVLSPFRSVQMFLYLAFIASGALGGFIALTQLIAALTNPARSSEGPDILTSLGIDIGAVSIFAFLYFRENAAKNAQIARLSREEYLSNLKLRVDQNKIISVSSLRGIALSCNKCWPCIIHCRVSLLCIWLIIYK